MDRGLTTISEGREQYRAQKRTMREINNVQHTVGQRQAEGDKCVTAPVNKPLRIRDQNG